jgi:hypothetical protein
MPFCHGKTRRGNPCSNFSENDCNFCLLHYRQKEKSIPVPLILEHDYLYKRTSKYNYWPKLLKVRMDPDYTIYSNNADFMLSIQRKLNFVNTNITVYNTHVNNKYITYIYIFTMELIILNHKNINLEEYCGMIEMLVSKVEPYEHLIEYSKYFYRTTHPEYLAKKLNARKKYIEFIIQKSDLGKDIAKQIIKFITL